MSLILNVTSSNNQALQQEMKFEFNEKGGTIGRRLSNSWVLPDENRHLSGTHATVEYVNGSYFIIDTSTNGVFINGSSKPLGKGERQELEDGFQLMMGTYNIHVGIVDETVDSESLEERSENLFADLDDDLDDPNGLLNEEEAFLEPDDRKVSSKEKNSLPPIDIGSDDPFYKFGEFTVDDEPAVKRSSKDDLGGKSDEWNSHYEPAKIKQPAREIDLDSPFPNDDQIIENKDSEESDSSVIPDGWNTSEDNSLDDLWPGIEDPFQTTEEHIDKIKEEDENLLQKSKFEMEDPFIEKEKLAESHENEKKKSESLNVEKKDSLPNSPLLMSAFINGLGLDEKTFAGQFTEKDLYLAGKLFRIAVQGTMEVLQSRAEIKNEMRMDMTTIQPIQNNPIKFAINIEEALSKLLIKKNKSYMNPEEAMEEAYDDIKSHQVAVISGIQASLAYVLKRFEPENLIERLQKESPISANIPIHRQAKLWDKFETLYETIESEAEDDFNRLFGQEFAKAYDEQVALLKNKRKK